MTIITKFNEPFLTFWNFQDFVQWMAIAEINQSNAIRVHHHMANGQIAFLHKHSHQGRLHLCAEMHVIKCMLIKL